MSASSYAVLLTTSYFEPGHRAGGPVRSVARIIDTAGGHVSIKALTRDRDLGSDEPYPSLSGRWSPRGRAGVYYLNTAKPGQWRSLFQALRPERFDLLYCNSLWDPYLSVLPIMAVRCGLIEARDILIAPRGELSPGALRIKRRKKQLLLTQWHRLLSSKRVSWHASGQGEADDIRRIWPAATVKVVEDQTDLPYEPLPVAPRDTGVLSIVFVSRISPMKNLLVAIEALSHCRSRVALSIYGPIEDESYWARCRAAMARLPENVHVSYGGVLDAEKVRLTFAEHDLFLFPTLGENFGHVIAESLSAACPVLCSAQTPWTRALSAGGGLALPSPTSEAIGAAVQAIADMSPEQRFLMRSRAGEAYRTWRTQAKDENILDRMSRGGHEGNDEKGSK